MPLRWSGRAMTGISCAAPMSMKCSLGRLYRHKRSSRFPTARAGLVRMSPETPHENGTYRVPNNHTALAGVV